MKGRHVDYNESDLVERYGEHEWWIVICLFVLECFYLFKGEL